MDADEMPEHRTFSRVVVFTGGPVLDAQLLRFICHIEAEPAIDLVGIVSQSPVRGIRGMIVDLWRRRGILALPILLLNGLAAIINTLFSPGARLERRRTSTAVRSRIYFFDDVHSADALHRVRSLDPALGLVYGGPIIKPELFSIPELGTLGIHHGKVPYYRGKKTTFWALYNGETEVGVIIQKISDKLDAGDIIRQSTLSVHNRLLPLVRRDLENIGIDLYVDAVKEVLDGKASYVPQPAGSRPLYKDPTAIEIARFWGRYFIRLIRGRDAA
jgi:hypothetical protein